MAKGVRQTKGINLANKNGRGTSFEQQESFDDSLLPDAIELEKLKNLDPTIIEWIKERTAKEQDSRLDFNDRKIKLIEKDISKNHVIDLYTITCAFLTILFGMLFSLFLINSGLKIEGTIFAGITILLSANAFLNFRKEKNQKQ